MSEPFRFPKNPNEGREHTFVDDEGNNPYAEDNDVADADENAFTSPGYDNEPTYRPKYVAALSHRKGIVLGLGLVTLAIATLSIPFGYFSQSFQPLYLAVAFLNLALAMPTWMMGYADLRAMRAGAMDPSGVSLTRLGTIMAMLTTLVTIGLFGYFIVEMVLVSLRRS